MPDLDNELERFGRWLDAEIDEASIVSPLHDVDQPARHRRSTRLSAVVIGVAAVIVAGLLALANRHSTTAPAGPSDSTSRSPSSAATPTATPAVAVTDDSNSADDPNATAVTTLDPSALGTAPVTTDQPSAVTEPRVGSLHLVPTDRRRLLIGELTVQAVPPIPPAVVVGRPGGDGTFADVWWIDVRGDRVLPLDRGDAHPVGRSGGGSTGWVNERGHFVRVEAAPHTVIDAPPCPSGATLCVTAGSTLDRLLRGIAVDDTGKVMWTLPDGMVEIARTSRAFGNETRITTHGNVDIIVDDNATVADFLAARPADMRKVRVRGHDGWVAASYPLGPDRERYAAAIWEERPGATVMVTGTVSDDRLLAVADDLTTVSDGEWEQLLAQFAPTPADGTYVVVSGDTLLGIATKLGVSIDELLAANPQIDAKSFLVVGQNVRLPSR